MPLRQVLQARAEGTGMTLSDVVVNSITATQGPNFFSDLRRFLGLCRPGLCLCTIVVRRQQARPTDGIADGGSGSDSANYVAIFAVNYKLARNS